MHASRIGEWVGPLTVEAVENECNILLVPDVSIGPSNHLPDRGTFKAILERDLPEDANLVPGRFVFALNKRKVEKLNQRPVM